MMEKSAGLLRWAGRAGSKAGLGGVSRAGSMVGAAFKRSPVEASLTLGMLPFMSGMLKASPEAKAEQAAMRQTQREAASRLRSAYMTPTGLTKTANGRTVLTGLHRLYDTEELTKQASVGQAVTQAVSGSAGKTARNMFLVGAGIALGNQVIEAMGAGVEGVAKRVKDKVREGSQDARWKAILKYDPDLAKMPYAKDAFATIDRASPYLASEPLLAASAVRTLVTAGPAHEGGVPVVDMRMVKSVLDVEGTRKENRSSGKPRQSAFSSLKPTVGDFTGGHGGHGP